MAVVSRNPLTRLLAMAAGETGWGERIVRNHPMTPLIARHETTSAGLTWIWYLLAQRPEAGQKLKEGLAQVLGGRVPRVGDWPKRDAAVATGVDDGPRSRCR